jgi:hypothetical protein
MSVAFVQEFKIDADDRSTTNYDTIRDQLNFDDGAGVFRIFDVWETREQAERFQQDRLMPIVEKMMATRDDATPPDRQDYYELHDLNRS